MLCQIIIAQDLGSCNTNNITLQDDGNNFSSSALASITFDSNCACNTASNCEVVSVEIPSSYSCVGLVVSLDDSQLWNEDYFDIYYLPNCNYQGNDLIPFAQLSNYLVWFDSAQTGGTFDMLICTGDDLPVGDNTVDIDILTSDLCYIVDCSNDFDPPLCTGSSFTVQLDIGQDYYTFDINDFASDDCDVLLSYEGVDLDPSTPNGIETFILPGQDDQFSCGTYQVVSSIPFDDAGNWNDCAFTFTVECTPDTTDCQNAGLDFSSNIEYIDLQNVTAMSDFTLGCWAKSNETGNGGAQDRIFAFGPEKRLEIGVNQNGQLWIFDSVTNLNMGFDNIQDGEWHHIAYVAKGNTRSFYLDFEVVHEYSTPNIDYGSHFRIGNWLGSPSSTEMYTGQLDDVIGYDMAFSQQQLCDVFASASLPFQDNLQMHFDFEEGVSAGNNSGISTALNQGLLDDGVLNNFALSGDASNYVCVDYTNSQCSPTDPSNCISSEGRDYLKLIGNDQLNFPRKVEQHDGNIYLLSNDGITNEEISILAKYNSIGEEVWKITWEDSTRLQSYFIDENRIFLTGFKGPFDNGNSSLFVEVMDQGSTFDVVQSNVFDISSQRERSGGVIKLNDNNTPYAMHIHEGAFSIDDVQIALLNQSGQIVDIRSYDLSDDQVWSGPVNDLDYTISVFGEEANDTNEGFLINVDYSLDDYQATSFFGIGYIRDVAVDFVRRQRVIASNRSLTLVDENYGVLHSITMPDVTLNRSVEGPFDENGVTTYIVTSDMIIDDSRELFISKFIVTDNNELELWYCKQFENSLTVLSNTTSIQFVIDGFTFLVSQFVDNDLSDEDGGDILIAEVSESSCHLIDYDLQYNAITLNVVDQDLSLSTLSVPEMTPLLTIPNTEYACDLLDNCTDFTCEEECQAAVIDLSTGVDFIDGSLLPIGEYDGGWVMISGPDMTLNYPQPGYVLNPNSAWSDQLNAQFISPFANTDNNMGFDIPYLFERKFCICESTTVELDVQALVDNFIEVGLYDQDGVLIQQLIDIQTNSTNNFQIPTPSNTTHQLQSGTYSIRAGLRNDSAVSMGFALEASLTGAGLIESGCCSPFQYITGTIFEDITCDSIYSMSTDLIISDVQINLYDSTGELVDQTLSDGFGFYTFFDLVPGDYEIEQEPIEDYMLTLGSVGVSLTVDPNSVSSNIDFGNCNDPCLNDVIPPVTNCESLSIVVELGPNGDAIITENSWDIISTDDCGQVILEAINFTATCDDVGKELHWPITLSDLADNDTQCNLFALITDSNNYCNPITCDSINVNNSLIPNASFEELTNVGDEPNNHSQLSKAKDWEQATEATSDYFSVVHYPERANMVNPSPPNGSDHFVGGWRIVDHEDSAPEDYIEYVGTCLDQPLVNGVDYTINFLLGCPDMTMRDDAPNELKGEYVVLGIPHCNFPISGVDCKEDDYEVIGRINIDIPNNTWESHQVVVNSFQEYPAIMLGIGCNTPLEGGIANYFLLDDLVVVQGNPCEMDDCEPICSTIDFNLSLDPSGNATLEPSMIDNGSYDKCSEVFFELSQTSFTCDDIGENEVTLFVSDVSGNVAQCSNVIVTITDPNNSCSPATCDSINVNSSLIPNASFEELVTIGNEPNNHSQLSKAKDWEQATEATSDYFSVVHYPERINMVNPPPPNGSDHFVGGLRTVDHEDSAPEDYIEYVGACLDQPLTNGVDYTINFLLGCPDLTMRDEAPNELKGEFVVLGIPHCNFPISGIDCKEDDYEVIGRINIDIPNNTWESHQVVVNSIQDYPAIMLGTGCNTPLEGGIFNYFLLDDLVVVQGNPCEIDDCDPICSTIDINLSLDPSGNATLEPTMIDNGSYDLCSEVSFELSQSTFTCDDIGENEVILYVSDASGNIVECTSIVTIEDKIAPQCLTQEFSITLNANGRRTINANQIDNGSFDNCSTVTLSLNQTVFTCSDIGENTVTLTVTDDYDNTSTCTAVLTVADTVKPKCETTDIEITLNANGLRNINASQIDAGSSDNCEELSYELDRTSFNCEDIGENEVVLTVTDGSGNTSTCTAIVTVADTVKPKCETTDIEITLNANGLRNINASQIDAGSSDNCDELSYELDRTVFTCEDIGDNEVTLTVTDGSGNLSSCSAIVSVSDITKPTCSLNDTKVELDESGFATLSVDQLMVSTSDNCGGVSTSVQEFSFDCSDVGPNDVVVTVTDLSGNSSTCTAMIEVIDPFGPTCNLNDLTFDLTQGEIVNLTPDMFVNESSLDNCGDFTPFIDVTSLGCSDSGINIVSITLIDSYNNITQCTAEVQIKCLEVVIPEGCEEYDGESANNWNTIAASATIQDGGQTGDGDFYLEVSDGSGASWAYNNQDFGGDYSTFVNTCICYDYLLINDAGDDDGLVTPRFYLSAGDPTNPDLRAVFVSSEQVSKESGWTQICATIETCEGGLPANDQGHWEMTTGEGCEDWDALLSNVYGLMFWIDLTSSPSEVHGFDNICIETCPLGACETESINVSSGYDPIADESSSPESIDANWTLTAVPPNAGNVILPRPAYLIESNSAWAQQSGAVWISPQPIPGYGTNNCLAQDCTCDPYTLERCFCVTADQEVTLDFSIYSDDKIELYLIDGVTGTELLIASNCSSSPNHFGDPLIVNEILELANQEYCLEARLFNTGGVAMGINLVGNITGINLDKDICCSSVGRVVGSVYEDLNCDGIRAQNSLTYIDPALSDISVSLCNADGTSVAMTTTDVNGIYSFVDIVPGDYVVKTEPLEEWTLPEGSNAEMPVVVDVLSTEVIDFGYCIPNVCCIDKSVFEEFFFDVLDVNIEECGEVCLSLDVEYDICDQYTLNWGDGVQETLSSGVDYKHTYNGDETYTVCLTVSRVNENGVTCNKYESCQEIGVDLTGCTPCEPFNEFCERVDQGYSYALNGQEVSLQPIGLLSSDRWIVDWGDGNIGNGTYYFGESIDSHTYESPGSYVVCLNVLSFAGDMYCEEKSYCEKIQVSDTEICCKDEEAFLRQVDLSFKISFEDCFVSVQSLEVSNCIDAILSWGDGESVDVSNLPTSYFHEYDGEGGTYEVCINYNESSSNEVCWKHIECFTVELDCVKESCCQDDQSMIVNGSFSNLDQGSITPSNQGDWLQGYYTPQINNLAGCEADGALLVWGNAYVSESSYQEGLAFVADSTYRISFCSRFLYHADKVTTSGRVRIKASNSPYANQLDCPSSDCEEVIVTHDIYEDWETVCLDWTPSQDYSILTLSASNEYSFNDGAYVSFMYIDDLCIEKISVVEPNACCGTAVELTDAALTGVGFSNGEIGPQCAVQITDGGLLDCQSVTSVDWGDGTMSTVEDIEDLPQHAYEENGSYTVCYTVEALNANGGICSKDSLCQNLTYIDCTLSSSEEVLIGDFTYHLYPNPVNDLLRLRIDDPQKVQSVKIYSVDGKIQIENYNVTELITFDLERFSPGIYIMRIADITTHNYYEKVIKI